MEAVDTNVLIRILVDDAEQPEQVRQARSFAKKAETVFVPQIVQVELVWVLESAYKFDHAQVIYILKHLRENAAFVLQNEVEFAKALDTFESTHADFSDCLILAESEKVSTALVTFDKKFAKLAGVKKL